MTQLGMFVSIHMLVFLFKLFCELPKLILKTAAEQIASPLPTNESKEKMGPKA